MSIKIRPQLLLTILISLHVAPAFSSEEVEVKAAVIPHSDVTGTITKEMARDLIESGKSGEQAVAIITSPTDGSTIKAMARNKLEYRVTGTNAFHAQLYIDGKKSAFLRKLTDTKGLAKLPAGVHELCIQALNKSHEEVGTAHCVKVTAQ